MAFYHHWKQACKQAGVKMHPHQTRHWFVTTALRKIQALPADEWDSARDALIAYMGWKNPQTITVYDHHVRATDFGATHAAITKLVQSGDKAPVDPDDGNTAPARSPTNADAIPQWMWEQVNDILDGQ
jgi:hypothetical protein